MSNQYVNAAIQRKIAPGQLLFAQAQCLWIRVNYTLTTPPPPFHIR